MDWLRSRLLVGNFLQARSGPAALVLVGGAPAAFPWLPAVLWRERLMDVTFEWKFMQVCRIQKRIWFCNIRESWIQKQARTVPGWAVMVVVMLDDIIAWHVMAWFGGSYYSSLRVCVCVCVYHLNRCKTCIMCRGPQPIFLCCPTKLRKMWWMGSWTREPVLALNK